MIHYKFLSTALLLGTVMLWSSCSDIEEDFRERPATGSLL